MVADTSFCHSPSCCPSCTSARSHCFLTSDERVKNITLVSIVVLLISFLLMLWRMPAEGRHCICDDSAYLSGYNFTYPLSEAQPEGGGTWYRIAAVSDIDLDSKVKNEKNMWNSYLMHGRMFVSDDLLHVKVVWSEKLVSLNGSYALGGRAMELSDLKTFNGHLYAIDDRTGIVYRIDNEKTVLPWVVLPDGDGHQAKGFKGEWLAVKDNHLYVGGLGKEWTTTTGEYVNDNPMWVKIVSYYGFVRHVSWKEQYVKLRKAFGIIYPGYMIHESAQWSDVHQKWFFLPRRASKDMYTEKTDERSATNVMLITDENFDSVETRQIGKLNLIRGFSAFQFVPGTGDSLILALKSEEDNGQISSYVTVFDINGSILLNDAKISDKFKFEGIEFI